MRNVAHHAMLLPKYLGMKDTIQSVTYLVWAL